MIHRSRLVRVAAGLVSLAALLALVAAVPVGLWLLAGWPLPASVPSLHGLGHRLAHDRLADATLIKLIAAIGWIAWLQVLLSLITETLAWSRGRPTPRLRVAGPAQPLIRKVVATIALLLSTVRLPGLPIASASPVRASALVTQPVVVESRPPAQNGAAALQLAGPTMASPTYTVVRYDTLWGLAERHLGDPFRWHEIYELNEGRPQSDGRTLTDPNLIVVGWTLTFPADAAGVVDPPVQHPSSPPVMELPEPSPPAPPPAEEIPVPAAPATPPSTSVEGPTVHDQSTRDRSGTTVLGDAQPGPADASTPSTPVDDAAPDHGSAHTRTPAFVLLGGGLTAVGLVLLLGRLRRVQQRQRTPGLRPRALPPELEDVERRLRQVADFDDTDYLDAALRAFAAGSDLIADQAAKVLAVRAGSGQVELLLSRSPGRPPKGFVTTDDDRGWITEPSVDLTDLRLLASDTGAPLPSLVAIGEVDGDQLLIDIETTGVLTIGGSGDAAASIVDMLTMQIATSVWSDHVDVLVVGEASETPLAHGARVRHIADIDVAITELAGIASEFHQALELAGRTSTLAARLTEAGDGWIPTILISNEPADDTSVERLRAITGAGGRGVGAIVRSERRAKWHAHVESDQLTLSPLGFSLDVPTAHASDEHAIEDLLADATSERSDESDELAVEQSSDGADELAVEQSSTGLAVCQGFSETPWEIEVQVLGSVQIVGLAEPLERSKALELTAYLGLHPRGVSDDRIKTALWSDREPTDGTFNTTVSYARTHLGTAADGTMHFPRYSAASRVYRLGPAVTTDVARFEAFVTHGRACPTDAGHCLSSALELVRGQPFEAVRGYEWAFSEGFVAAIEAMVADAAHRLAEIHLAAVDPAAATWAALQGLKACPGDEVLYRDRMLACDLAGNPAGVETVMAELCEVVEALEPFDSLHPETLALYERLTHGRRPRRRR